MAKYEIVDGHAEEKELERRGISPADVFGTSNKIILDLCGGTGSWSKPYKDAGYDVRLITLPGNDVRAFVPPEEPVYGILAAPPCTMFSFARTSAKNPRDLRAGMDVVIACLQVIWQLQERLDSDLQKYPPVKFWALENPYYGMISWFLGRPNFVFDPWEFNDSYQKKTALWGYFNEPVKTGSVRTYTGDMSKGNVKFDMLKSKDIHPESFGKFDRQTRRAITPAGFAQAFFEANR